MASELQTVVQREALLLAPYAMHSADSAGREHEEPEHPYRGPFQRDRDRILHSAAFRRLSGKMQVFTGEMGDYHRTRLTHTHEVASIARTIGRTLRLNEDLIEALALFHDIGHPPFGHAGEDALDECLADHGGFSHNQHALTIAEELETRYHGFPGLNLTTEVLDGQRTRIGKNRPGLAPLLEVQVVEAADSITYDAHDVDDAVELGLVSLEELASNELVREVIDRARARTPGLTDDLLRRAAVHDLIDVQVSDVLEHAATQLARSELQSVQDARQSELRITTSPPLTEVKVQLERFLYDRVYRHPDLIQVRAEAQDRLRRMFAGYLRRPKLMPERFRSARADIVGLPRAVGEYIGGMTDRFCNLHCDEHFGESGG